MTNASRLLTSLRLWWIFLLASILGIGLPVFAVLQKTASLADLLFVHCG